MSYLKINGSDERYNVEIQPFTTQHNKRAVKFIGDEIPSTDQGFKLYSDDDEVILDLSAFTYEYSSNSYSVEEDIIENPEPNNEPTPPNPLDVRLNQMSQQINAITPYTDSKVAYYGENEKVFYGVPLGNLTVFFDNYDGEYKTERISDRLVIIFPERLEDLTNITIKIEQ